MNWKEKIRKIDKATIIRVALFIASLMNLILGFLGVYGFSDAIWFRIVSVLAAVLSSAAVAWENNDFTFFARLGTKVLDALEDKKITVEEVENLLDPVLKDD